MRETGLGPSPGEVRVTDRLGVPGFRLLAGPVRDGTEAWRPTVSVRTGGVIRLGAPPTPGLDSKPRVGLNAVLGGEELFAVRA